MRQRRLATAGRPPQNHGGETIRFDRVPERSTLADNFVLARQIIERMRTHPFGQTARSIVPARSGASNKSGEGS